MINPHGTRSKLVFKCGCKKDTTKEQSFSFHKPGPVAYFKNEKTGEMIPVDKKGNKIDNDPYYKERDPRGWKRAGKGTKGYKRKVFLDEKGNELIQ